MKPTLQSLLARHAHRAVADIISLGRRGGELSRQSYTASALGIAVNISIVTVSVPILTELEAAIVAVLAKAPCRLTTSGVLRALADSGNHFSEPSVKRSLARLHKAHIICNSTRIPRGYWMPARFPEWDRS